MLLNFSQALKEMKRGLFVKRKDSLFIYSLKDGLFKLYAKEDDVDRIDPIFEYQRSRNGVYDITMFEHTRYTENFSVFDEEDLLSENWCVVDSHFL